MAQSGYYANLSPSKPGPTADRTAELMSAKGISRDSTVVFYRQRSLNAFHRADASAQEPKD